MTNNNSMDVDPPKDTTEEKSIAVHPLAIVHMSDQYTRITCGGSPLDTNAPVVGLLFGMLVENDDDDDINTSGDKSNGKTSSKKLKILDADDIPTDVSEASAQQVELHRAVFPQHSVVGWYRVSSDEEPTPNDLRLTQQLGKHYQKEDDFVFSLLQVRSAKEQKEANELPLTLYQVNKADGSAPVLLALSNWNLETSEPERIAVERVVREQPQHDLSTDGKDTAKPTSTYVSHVQSVQHSMQSMKDRVNILITYLEQTQRGEVPRDPALLRQVQGLIYSLGPLAAGAPSDDCVAEALLLGQLAAVAKTVSTVQAYTDKFRLLQENRPLMGKESRRAF